MDVDNAIYDIVAAHRGSDNLLINNKRCRRAIVRLATKTTARLLSPVHYRACTPIFPGWIVKRQVFGHLIEATTMQYVASRTMVPVPRVYTSFIHNRQTYIVMERPEGITLFDAFETYPREDILAIYSQLRLMIQSMRSIPLPRPYRGGVYNCNGGSVRSFRQKCYASRIGPFPTIEDFHWTMRDDFHYKTAPRPPYVSPRDWEDLEDMVELQEASDQLPVFTHGNLQPCNIIVSGRQVVSIIGWENAGFFPKYWEYTTAWTGCELNSVWKDEIDRFLDTYHDGLFCEQVRLKYWKKY
ncbi:hypothetical protein SBRCBS47491_007453 [Sporothrix bragantina]|uniref:Aminoglycoside phosphotransferase domain-containing protein n=1 Tax=Sporothrix bragantina TaxID=671064 RepID=A0ABP0CDE1_9PEZI